MTALVRVSIVVSGGVRKQVGAYPSACPGLVIHPAGDRDGWSLTHVLSGLACGRFADAETAFSCSAELAPLADWTQPVDYRALRPSVWPVLVRWGTLTTADEVVTPELARTTAGVL